MIPQCLNEQQVRKKLFPEEQMSCAFTEPGGFQHRPDADSSATVFRARPSCVLLSVSLAASPSHPHNQGSDSDSLVLVYPLKTLRVSILLFQLWCYLPGFSQAGMHKNNHTINEVNRCQLKCIVLSTINSLAI